MKSDILTEGGTHDLPDELLAQKLPEPQGRATKSKDFKYNTPEVFYREGACFVNVDSGLHSPMSNEAARKDCSHNAAIEKALLGAVSSQVCKCAISFSEGSRLANEGAIRSRRCGRDQSA